MLKCKVELGEEGKWKILFVKVQIKNYVNFTMFSPEGERFQLSRIGEINPIFAVEIAADVPMLGWQEYTAKT